MSDDVDKVISDEWAERIAQALLDLTMVGVPVELDTDQVQKLRMLVKWIMCKIETSPPRRRITKVDALELARKHAAKEKPPYWTEPFVPHGWVMNAILEASEKYSDREIRLMAERDAALTRAEAAEDALKGRVARQSTPIRDVGSNTTVEMPGRRLPHSFQLLVHVDSPRTWTEIRDALMVRMYEITTNDMMYVFSAGPVQPPEPAAAPPAPIPMRIVCPACYKLHIDEGEFATKPHYIHTCQHCGENWRPALVPTVGVRFLPGFKNDKPPPADPESAPAPQSIRGLMEYIGINLEQIHDTLRSGLQDVAAAAQAKR